MHILFLFCVTGRVTQHLFDRRVMQARYDSLLLRTFTNSLPAGLSVFSLVDTRGEQNVITENLRTRSDLTRV